MLHLGRIRNHAEYLEDEGVGFVHLSGTDSTKVSSVLGTKVGCFACYPKSIGVADIIRLEPQPE